MCAHGRQIRAFLIDKIFKLKSSSVRRRSQTRTLLSTKLILPAHRTLTPFTPVLSLLRCANCGKWISRPMNDNNIVRPIRRRLNRPIRLAWCCDIAPLFGFIHFSQKKKKTARQMTIDVKEYVPASINNWNSSRISNSNAGDATMHNIQYNACRIMAGICGPSQISRYML